MKILYIGDIFGEEGLNYLASNMDYLKKTYKPNLIFANAENVSYGKGLHYTHYQRLMKMGINYLSMGNHTFSNVDIKNFIDKANIVRPANLPTTLGKGYAQIRYNDKTITLINLLGRVYQNFSLDCPFRKVDEILAKVKSDYYIIDFHAEATSEKIALAFDFDGKINALVGTHTHVQTADERILPKGTLYISDIGMTGPLNGVIGNTKEDIIKRFRTGVYERTGVATGPRQINAVIMELDGKKSIARVHIEEKTN